MKNAALRLSFWLNRFGTLRRAEKAVSTFSTPCCRPRPLFGFTFWSDVSRCVTQCLLFLEGERFIEERFLIARHLRPGMTVVDVGANIGYYLLLFQKYVGRQGKVICIEPSEENLPELRMNIDANRFLNVALHEVALGTEEGVAGLRSGINSGIVNREEGAYRVPLRRLDTLVSERVDFLKVDVEGYEGQVLAGACDLIERDRPLIFLELHPHIVGRFGFSTSRILRELAALYPKISLYERKKPSAESVWEKVATRYCGRDPLIRVEDADAYLARYNPGDIVHTFWAVCEP